MPDPNAPRLVTGATGLLGSHIAEKLAERGLPVRALVRPSSETGFLESLGVELVRGDLTDRAACDEAVRGVAIVYHAAAKVGDWGTWAEFQSGCLDATECLARASMAAGVGRFLHISSTSAYGHPPRTGRPIDETHPLGVGLWPLWDDYTRSKVESERLLWRLVAADGLPLTIIRPSWLYGERDRTTAARMIARLRGSGIPVIGPGDNPLSAIYAGNVADAAILASEDPGSVGEAYNVTDQGRISQREFIELWARAVDAGRARWYRRTPHPYPLVFAGSFAIEAAARLLRRPPAAADHPVRDLADGPADLVQHREARARLGWRPALGYEESIERTVRWFADRDRPAAVAGRPAVGGNP